jgi:hypothetical protein
MLVVELDLVEAAQNTITLWGVLAARVCGEGEVCRIDDLGRMTSWADLIGHPFCFHKKA